MVVTTEKSLKLTNSNESWDYLALRSRAFSFCSFSLFSIFFSWIFLKKNWNFFESKIRKQTTSQSQSTESTRSTTSQSADPPSRVHGSQVNPWVNVRILRQVNGLVAGIPGRILVDARLPLGKTTWFDLGYKRPFKKFSFFFLFSFLYPLRSSLQLFFTASNRIQVFSDSSDGPPC